VKMHPDGWKERRVGRERERVDMKEIVKIDD
jgi:hypothetical protein